MNIKKKLKQYLDSYLEETITLEERTFGNASRRASFCHPLENIDNYIEKNKEETIFQTKLFKYIDKKQLKDSDVYNKVGIDRRLFSKIRSNKDYHPSKETIILLGLALELQENEIEDLLNSASYSLPKNTIFDLIIRFCFKEKIYNINKVNEFLYDYNCKTLN